MFQEQILLLPGLNGTELLRTLARFGKNTFGLRVMNAGELAEAALLRSGITVPLKLLSPGAEPAVFADILREIPYFAAASYKDAENMSLSLRSLRMLLPEEETALLRSRLKKGEFPQKNEAILQAYERYVRFLETEKLMDTVGLLRYAVSHAKPVTAEVLTLEEYPVSPLETRLLNTVSGGRCRAVTLRTLFGREAEEASEKPSVSMVSAYGAANEAEDVIAQIYRGRYPLDECLIAAADASACSHRLYNLCSRLSIPVTFGTGLPIGLSFPAVLLKKWKEWSGKGAFGKDALRELLGSDALRKEKREQLFGTAEPGMIRRITDAAGRLRIGTSRETNALRISAWSEVLPEEPGKEALVTGVRALAASLEAGCGAFIGEYAVVRNENTDPDSLPARLDRAAIVQIRRQMADYARYNPSEEPEVLIDNLLTHTVCREMSREGCLHVTSIEAAPAALRKNLYVTGLSASAFPGTPREDYLILDSDYLLFSEPSVAPTSGNRVMERLEALRRLVRIGGSCGCTLHFSFSCYRAAELKNDNPSSVLYELYRELINGSAAFEEFRSFPRRAGFYGTSLNASDALGRAYMKGEVMAPLPAGEENAPVLLQALKLSPTAVETYLECPRRFYLKYLLHVPETDPDDPYEVINARDLGTLVHEQMERLADPKQPEEEFLASAERAFETFLRSRPPVLESQAREELQNFLTLVKNGYELDPGNHPECTEEELSALHPSGILLEGRTDRLERTPDGRFVIADYKNKQSITHESGNFNSCVQAVLYAWMAIQNGIPVESCEFRYLYQRQIIRFPVNEDALKQLDALLYRLRNAADGCDFPPAEDAAKADGPCKYCRVRETCRVDSSEEEES